jgi:hypothetical protein
LLQPYVPRRWSAVVAAASAKTQRPLQTHRPFKRDSQFQIGGLFGAMSLMVARSTAKGGTLRLIAEAAEIKNSNVIQAVQTMRSLKMVFLTLLRYPHRRVKKSPTPQRA